MARDHGAPEGPSGGLAEEASEDVEQGFPWHGIMPAAAGAVPARMMNGARRELNV